MKEAKVISFGEKRREVMESEVDRLDLFLRDIYVVYLGCYDILHTLKFNIEGVENAAKILRDYFGPTFLTDKDLSFHGEKIVFALKNKKISSADYLKIDRALRMIIDDKQKKMASLKI